MAEGNTKFCPQCGAKANAEAPFCSQCGAAFNRAAANQAQPQPQRPAAAPYPQGQPMMNQVPQGQYNYGQPQKQPKQGLAIAGMVLGIVGLAFSLLSMGTLGIVGIICALVGVILSGVARAAGNTGGIAMAGLVTSIICLGLSIVVFIACAICVGSLGTVSTTSYYL